jgi:hypothetical protein
VTRSLSTILAFGLCVLAGACATTIYAGPSAGDSRVGDAMQQPFRDINWTRENPPEILKHAASDPYVLSSDAQCDAILADIDALNAVLGPDVDSYDVDATSSVDAGGLTAGAVLSVIGLPFRGVFRWLSGAEHREKLLADAILSGVARRSFLKGAARNAGCVSEQMQLSAPSESLSDEARANASPD